MGSKPRKPPDLRIGSSIVGRCYVEPDIYGPCRVVVLEMRVELERQQAEAVHRWLGTAIAWQMAEPEARRRKPGGKR